MSINHTENRDQPDHVSATNYGHCTPNSHSIVVRCRSAVPFLPSMRLNPPVTPSPSQSNLKMWDGKRENTINSWKTGFNAGNSSSPGCSRRWNHGFPTLLGILPEIMKPTPMTSPFAKNQCLQSVSGEFIVSLLLGRRVL